MKDGTYDRLLTVLVLLAPLTMLVLSKWRASLDVWYAPLDDSTATVFDESFERQAAQWARQHGGSGAELILIVDRDCPCTRATVARLEAAHAQSSRRDARLTLRDVDDLEAPDDPRWRILLDGIPSTPTLLAVDRGELLYAGPATSGNFCTIAVNRVLGLSAMEMPRSRPVLNWLDKGCYCRLGGART